MPKREICEQCPKFRFHKELDIPFMWYCLAPGIPAIVFEAYKPPPGCDLFKLAVMAARTKDAQ